MMLVEVSCVDAIVRKPMASTLILNRGVLLGAYEFRSAQSAAFEGGQQSHTVLRGSPHPAKAVHFDQSGIRVRSRHRFPTYDDYGTAVATSEGWRLGLRLP